MDVTTTPVAEDQVRVRQESITLLAYPYETFQRDALDRTYNVPYKRFDADGYAASTHTAVEKRFRTIVVENEYLRLTFLPDLGGRLYQVLYKPTGQRLFYNKSSLKPTPWGPASQGGWLAVGGMEWALPVNEHGYEWGVPWTYTVDTAADHVTLTLQDSPAANRVRAQIAVTLPAHAAYFIVRPRVINGTRATVPIQFWINAMLALDEKNVSPETEFILHGAEVFIHSTGNTFIPAANVPPADAQGPANPVPWPVIGGRDLSRYKNWQDYLGLFLTGSGTNIVGAYDHANDLGIVRVFPRETVRGVKLFAWGPRFGGRDLFADDGSDYFELWGGLAPTFYGYQDWPFAPGEAREWDEYWIPLSHTEGVGGASRDVVLNLVRESDRQVVVIAAAAARGTRGTMVLEREGMEQRRWDVTLDPAQVFREQVDIGGTGRLKLQFRATDGRLVAEAISQ